MNQYQSNSNWTGRTPRTSRDAFGLSPSESTGIEHHQAPLPKRLFFALCRHGWIVVVTALLLSVISGCGEAKDWGADQASLADAIAQASRDAGK